MFLRPGAEYAVFSWIPSPQIPICKWEICYLLTLLRANLQITSHLTHFCIDVRNWCERILNKRNPPTTNNVSNLELLTFRKAGQKLPANRVKLTCVYQPADMLPIFRLEGIQWKKEENCGLLHCIPCGANSKHMVRFLYGY